MVEFCRSLPALLLAIVGCLVLPAYGAPSVVRGKALATDGDCAVCHTAPGATSPPYAGGYALHAYFGTVVSTNITPDRQTGIGRWTAVQFYHALHDGVAAGGHYLYPAFPYPYFTKLSRQDSDDIFAYLKTVKPVNFTPPPSRLIFPADIRFGMYFWDLLFLDKTPIPVDPRKSALWNRGNQLVNTSGHCAGCHTPKTFYFTDEAGKTLQGETIDGWYAPNLTSSARTGLGAWSVGDIVQYLKTGKNRFGRVVGAMQDVVRVSTSRLSDHDRTAIATYLKSLPAAPEKARRAPTAGQMRAGQAVYVENCAVCHTADTQDYPGLAGNSVVRGPDPMSLLHVVLDGSQSVPVAGMPVGFSMPAFKTLSDADLAAVASYVRNSWGNRAGAVSLPQAREIRRLVTARRYP